MIKKKHFKVLCYLVYSGCLKTVLCFKFLLNGFKSVYTRVCKIDYLFSVNGVYVALFGCMMCLCQRLVCFLLLGPVC